MVCAGHAVCPRVVPHAYCPLAADGARARARHGTHRTSPPHPDQHRPACRRAAGRAGCLSPPPARYRFVGGCAMAESRPRTLGRYVLHEQIGEGGMARVYRAYDPAFERWVAIKVINPILAAD